MKISVIIPTYNRVATLPHAIRSIQAQSGAFELDILVVDDGSQDDTASVVTDLSARDPRVRYVHRENGGVAAARNTGLQNLPTDADLVTFLDSDDLLAPDRISTDLQPLLDDPALELCYGRMTYVDALDYRTMAPSAGARTAKAVGIHLSCALMRRSLIDRIGAFDETLRQAEDTDYLFRIFESKTPHLLTDTNCLYYLKHDGGITCNVDEARRNFMLALHRSLQRRRRDPSQVARLPDFGFEDALEGSWVNGVL